MKKSMTKSYLMHVINLAGVSALCFNANLANAACVNNFDGTYLCSGDSSNIDAYLTGTFILNNGGGPVSLTNQTTDPNIATVPGFSGPLFGSPFDFPPEYGAILRHTILTVGGGSTITTNGSGPVVINNVGVIEMATSKYNPAIEFFDFRTFDPSTWAYDEVTHSLTNGGVEVGYAAAITTDPLTQSLTINNASIGGPYDPAVANTMVLGEIRGSGDLAAAIYTKVPILVINNGTNTGIPEYDAGVLQKVVTYAGGSFTPPSVLDGSGTQQATNVVAGVTIINNRSGFNDNLYIVDKNPFLTEAQALSGLTLATTQADVGPRNSIINNVGGSLNNVFLGSGAHIINVNSNGRINGTINVDQRDTAVTEVVGGVEIPQYLVHGDRTFTLNLVNSGVGGSSISDIVINDVAGAVNTINLSGNLGSIFNSFTANGLGNNTFNYNCSSTPGRDSIARTIARCDFNQNTISGFTEVNIAGAPISLNGTINASGNIHLTSQEVQLLNGNLTAANVVVGSNTSLIGSLFPNDTTNGFNAPTLDGIGTITGNLINNGSVNIGSSVFNINGNATFNSGSTLIVGIGLAQGNGKINATGTTTFASDTTLIPYVKSDNRVTNGQSFVFATNASGLPNVVNSSGFLQWAASESTGDLVLTANLGVPTFLADQVTMAAKNAVSQVFSYTGNNALPVELQTYLIQLRDKNVSRAAERLRPEINDGAIRMVLGNTDKVFSIVGTRNLDHYLSSRRISGATASADFEPIQVASNSQTLSGMASVNGFTPSSGIWVQGFGDRGSQDSLRGVDGYNSSSAGMAAGIDRTVGDTGDISLGAVFGYARGNVTDSGSTVNNRTDINSFLGAVYGTWARDDWYVSGVVGIGRNTYESQRHLGVYTATGRHDSWQFSSRVDAGWPILVNQNVTLVPIASLDYSHIKESGFTEDGTVSRVTGYENTQPVYSPVDSPINMQLQGRNFDSIRSGLGGKVIYSLQQPGWGAELELRGMYRHEFGDIAQNSTARFTQFGTSFSSPGLKPERDGLLVGSSVRLSGDDNNDQITFLASYDADIREKYLGQIMSLNLRWDFDGAPRYLRAANARKAADTVSKSPKLQVAANANDIKAMQQAMQARHYDTNIALPMIDPQQEKAVDEAIKEWTTALGNKSLDVYFNSYAANFITPDGSTRQQWERKRKVEIIKAENPAIKISDLTIAPQGDHASAMFTQTLSIGTQQESVQKIVDFENRDGRWLIVREDSVTIQ